MAHSSRDKPAVRDLYFRLKRDGFSPWLDEEDLLPGQEWPLEISRALRECQVALVCLSSEAITKEGYFQKEMRIALDIADEQPEGSIYLIPVRLERCAVPERLADRHWLDIFKEGAYRRLRQSLEVRAQLLGIQSSTRISQGDGSDCTKSAGTLPALIDRHPLEGEYLVEGTDDRARAYRGNATIREQEGYFFVISRIGLDTHICRGTVSGNSLDVDGDFKVHYEIHDGGILDGTWGSNGTEKLIRQYPVDRITTQKIGGPVRSESSRRRS